MRRLYTGLGLARKRRLRRRIKVTRRQPMTLPQRQNDVWAMDFVSDRTEQGNPFRIFAAIDVKTRQCVTLESGTSMPSVDISRFLNEAIEAHGRPSAITCDNGPEFRSKHFQTWAAKQNIDVEFIEPGKPTKNAYAESFNGMLRSEFLNTHFFPSLAAAKELLGGWKHKYKNIRRHSSLGGLPPALFAKTLEAR